MILFFYQVILPMLGLTTIAIKILLKNGKDLRRELVGVKVNPHTQSTGIRKIQCKFFGTAGKNSVTAKN